MTNHYINQAYQRLKELQELREHIESLEELARESPFNWAKPLWQLRIDEKKLLYKEKHKNHLEFKHYQELEQ